MKKDSSLSEDLHNFIDEATIRKEMARYENPDPDRKRLLTGRLARMEAGERDLYL